MGYTTEFKGELEFNYELSASELSEVKKFLGEDCRQHPEWEGSKGLSYVDLEFTDDFSGLRWNGAEKTYDMVDIINMITVTMNKKYKHFCFKGKLIASGEEYDDVWELVIKEDGLAEKKELKLVGDCIECPNCECMFIYNPDTE